MADGFLSRWSRRKLELRQAGPLPGPPAPSIAAEDLVRPQLAEHPIAELAPDQPVAPPDLPTAQAQRVPESLPTLADTLGLTPESDFRPFMARGVAHDVKNAAMKKLFADPHFNLMDRLDTYIDDYSLPDPIPEAMLRQMASARFLNLFGDSEKSEIAPAERSGPEPVRDTANGPAPEMVAQSQQLPDQPPPPCATPDPGRECPPGTSGQETRTDHDHIDLRLQSDHAAAAKSARRGAP